MSRRPRPDSSGPSSEQVSERIFGRLHRKRRDVALRDECADRLEALTQPGAALDGRGPRSTWNDISIQRVRTRARIVDEYMNKQDNVATDGLIAVVTAGPPGAGKSTHLHGRYDDTYRVIDADEIKDLLLRDAMANGTFDDLLTDPDLVLPDGEPLRLRELAVLVHDESAQLADRVRRASLSRGENLVIEGTLGWDGMPDRLASELTDPGTTYRQVDIYDVEPGRDTCVEHAKNRWWLNRCSADPMGGRFTPTHIIDRLYPSPPVGLRDPSAPSVCAANAEALQQKLRAAGITATLNRMS